MNYFERRKLRKAVHHLLHEARHARHMREDIVESGKIDRIKVAEARLKDAWEKEDYQLIEKAADELSEAAHAVYPPHKHPRMRENIEILVVAIAVAMAFRTFFIQPFRIPTGSMQPTLNGITFSQQDRKSAMDHFPLSLVSMALHGERYTEVKARVSGVVDRRMQRVEEGYLIFIAGVPHVIPAGMMDEPAIIGLIDQTFTKGEVIARGRRQLGDHIFVNRMKYNFSRPERGDVFVFSTKTIRHPEIRPDNYYIKRLVGLPGEAIRLDPPYLVANDAVVTNPPVFARQATAEEQGYHGYSLLGDTTIPALLRHTDDVIQLGPDEYLPFGDNTRASLDGRFFGGVHRASIVGPAVMVYWPFTKRWGSIN